MKPIRLVIVAVGGQGNLLASSVLGEAALLADVEVKMSEIHGMAQRGGVVESAIVFGDAKSTIISDGEADILCGFEPVETLRAVAKCNPNTVVVTNLSPLTPFTVSAGRETYPSLADIQELLRKKASRLIAFNAVEKAEAAGNVLAVNMVLLGAMAQTELFPFTADHVKDAIRIRTKKTFLESNLKAFDLGYETADQAV